MDHQTFDRLARLLATASDRRTGLKALVGGILGAGGLAALDIDADAVAKGKPRRRNAGKSADGPDGERRRKPRRKCDPACGAGFACVRGQCRCVTGVSCAGACCASGQICRDGACADPLPTCLAAGEPCKNTGRRCCDGRVCASGQGGDQDIACYAPKTGACERTADCVYGMACRDGRCKPPQPGDLGQACDPTSQQLCSTPGATCGNYTGPGAPAGPHCSLPLRMICSGDSECSCYRCWYTTATVATSTRSGRLGTRKACCNQQGETCAADADCCFGLECVGGICGAGIICVPDEAPGCGAAAPCCSANAICLDGSCELAVATGDECSTAPGSLPCAEAPNATCIAGETDTALRCRKQIGGSCDRDRDCASDRCDDGACVECAVDADCVGVPNKPACNTATNTCVQCTSGNALACTGGTPACDAASNSCVQCTASDTAACTGATPACNTSTSTCVQCTAGNASACTGATPVCKTSTGTCVQCTATADCASRNGKCGTFTCTIATNTCTANSPAPAINTRCDKSGTDDGYCQADGTCGTSVACNFLRADCGNSDTTCGTTLKSTIDGAGQGAVIGIPAGTYAMSASVVVDKLTVNANRQLTLQKCEAINPMLDGGWGGGATTTGQPLFKLGNARLTVDGVDIRNGYSPGWGGAITLQGVPLVPLGGTTPSITLKNLSIATSKALQGGAMYIFSEAALENVTITGCSADGSGGAIFADTRYGTGLTLKGVTITGNTANGSTGTGEGAGVFINTAKDGGVLTCSGTNTISNSAAAPVYDCGYDPNVATPAMRFDPANFAGCGCTTTES